MEAWWWPYLFILLAGTLATDIWRYLGVAFSLRLNEQSVVLDWVRAVSTALVAGLVARLIVFPLGALAETSLAIRLGAVAVGLAVFFALRRHMLAGIAAGEAVLLAALYLYP